jgi:hypothetical protein
VIVACCISLQLTFSSLDGKASEDKMEDESPSAVLLETVDVPSLESSIRESEIDVIEDQVVVNDTIDTLEIIAKQSKAIPGKSFSSAKVSSTETGQVVKLPPISDSAKYRNVKAAMNAPGGSSKLNKLNGSSANSSVSTQLTVASNQSKSGSTVPRNTFPSDSPAAVGKSRQPSISRSSISSNAGSSTTGPLPEMKVASMRIQPAQKKVPKAMSVSSGHPIGGSYRYKVNYSCLQYVCRNLVLISVSLS